MIAVYHVTEKENAISILSEGFEGGWGDDGFGVYVFTSLASAEAYLAKGGWDNVSSPEEMIILKLEAHEEDLRQIIPHPEWKNPEDYASIMIHDMEEGGQNWYPKILPLGSALAPSSPQVSLPAAEVIISEIGGYCPVQAEGTINGKLFYFRARGSRWSLGIGGDPVSNPEWRYEEPYGTGFDAGWMDIEEAKTFIDKASSLWVKASPENSGKTMESPEL